MCSSDLTLLFFLLGFHERKPAWLLAAWAFAALAVLSKGLIGIVLPGLVFIAYIIVQRDWRRFLQLRWAMGLVVFFAIAAPWFVLVQRANPEFFDFFFIHEHFRRFSTGEHRRPGAWWYFAPVLMFSILPWIPQLARALVNGWRHDARPGSGKPFMPARFLLLWSLLIFLFFSRSSSKLPSYILPILPALALLIGLTLQNTSTKVLKWQALMLLLGSAVIVVYAPYVTRWGNEKVPAELYANYTPWLYAAGIAGIVGFSLALWAAIKQQKHLTLIAMAVGTVITMQFAALGHQSLAPVHSAEGLARQIRPHLEREASSIPFYSVHMYEQTLDFYIKRTVTPVEFADELGFGLKQEQIGRAHV